MFSNDNSYTYGNALGRIQGNGRFNNVNSIIVNSKRIFLPEKYKENSEERNSRKVSYLNSAQRQLEPSTITSNERKYNLPTSFDSIKNKYFVPQYQRVNVSSSLNKNDFIEKIFYDYKKYNAPPINYSNTNIANIPKQNFSSYSTADISNPMNRSYDFHSQDPLFPAKPSMYLTPNILRNTSSYLSKINEIKHQKDLTKKQSPQAYTSVTSSSVKEYSYKQTKNEKYQLNIFEFSTAIDKFDSSFHQGLFCLFSGINGKEVAQYCSENLPELFQRNLRYNPKTVLPFKDTNEKSERKRRGIRTSTETLLLNTFLKLDDDIKYMNCFDIGATSCVVFLTKEKENITGFEEVKKVLYCTNCGEIQCLVINSTSVKRLSAMHNLFNQREKKRIDTSGGVIYNNKIYGQISLTRCFGMFKMKQYGVTVVPEVTKIYLNERDKFVVIGSKGVFDVLSEGDILLICNQKNTTEEIVEDIIENAIKRNTRENVSCFAIKL